MTDKTEYGADILTQSETIEGTWEYNGEEYKLEVKDISKQTLDLVEDYAALAQNIAFLQRSEDMNEDEIDERIEEINKQAEDLENFSWEDEDDDTDFIESIVNEKLVKPDIDPSEVRVHKLRHVFEGMFKAWQEGNG